MSQDCMCETPSVEIPVIGLKLTLPRNAFPDPTPNPSGSGLNIWESGWFNIAASGAYDFNHNLNLEKPWRCSPRIVGRVKVASGGWMVGEIIFGDGSNYVGTLSDTDFGWAISVDTNSAHVGFGNFAQYMGIPRAGGGKSNVLPKANVECKLVIYY